MAVRKTAAGARLKRWFKEKWKTPRGNKDYSKGENTFRPTVRVTKDTPTTWSELTPAEKARAQREKNTKGRVSRYKKKGDKKLRKAAKAASKEDIAIFPALKAFTDPAPLASINDATKT